LAVVSVQKNLYAPILQELDVLVPKQGVLLDFCTSVAPLFEKWKGNVAENRTLSQTRDSLLPRLMSGELSVPASATTCHLYGINDCLTLLLP
jgi:type I restriction enzyme S subunit